MAKRNSRGASKRQTAKSRNQMPGWLWLLTGVALGLFVAFLYHLAQIQQGAPKAPAMHQTDTEQATESTDNNEQEKDLPEFDFYAVLPKMEEVIPNHDKEQDDAASESDSNETDTSSDDSGDTSSETVADTSQPTPAQPADGSGRFLLQAGSFRNEDSAQRLRAEFTLQGFDVKVQPGKLDSGEVWYRVMIGPFNSKSALRQAQRKLAAEDVDTLAIHLKK